MYWIKNNNQITIGYENQSGFRGFATYKEVKAQADKDKVKIDDLLKKAGIFAWIKTTKGNIKKGSCNNQDFAEYATEKEVKEAGGELFQAEILADTNPKK